jgi:3-isopropylmalate/(R)-2-methylmalate dehydratase small subunit
MAKVVYCIGDDISTDVIYPGRYMATVLPSETPQFAFADDAVLNAKLKTKQIPPGSIILAGSNFGCGSSREQAVSTLKGHGLTIVAKSIARIFLQNAINLGLPLVVAPDLTAGEGDELVVEKDRIINTTTGSSAPIEPLPPARQAILDAGGLIPYTRKRLLQRAHAATT